MPKVWKNLIYTGVVIVVLAVAGWWWLSSGEQAYPDSEESKTAWMCCECGALIELTARERARLASTPGRVRTGSDDGVVMPGAARTVFLCEACRTFAVVRARRCPRHGEWYIVKDVAGAFVGCASCNSGAD